MNDAKMSWDQAILRKFSSTSHFRLIQQLRSELKIQPLIRDHHTKSLNVESRQLKQSESKNNKRPNALDMQETTQTFNNHSINDSPKSFKDRLDAIQMR